MFSVVAVFIPSFFMVGITRELFIPLSLAVGFAMIASTTLASTLGADYVRVDFETRP